MSGSDAGRELRKAVQSGKKLTARQREFLVDLLYGLEAADQVLTEHADGHPFFLLGASEGPVKRYREFVAEASGSDGAA